MEQAHAKYHTESERKIGMILWKHAVAQDLEKVTVLEICQEAGVSRGTFYRHFSNPKQALGKVISDYQAERMHGEGELTEDFPGFISGLLSLADPEDAFRRYMEMLQDPLMEKNLIRTLKEEMLRRGFFDPVIRGRHYLQAEKEVLTDTFCQAIVYVLMQRADGKISTQRAQRFICMLYGKLIRDETDDEEYRC